MKKILFFVLLSFVFLPACIYAEMPGTRSATNSSGDVFLGGNYIEIGISKSGSFGTSNKALIHLVPMPHHIPIIN